MGSDKYQAGISAGCILSRTVGDWPAEVLGLGPMRGGCPFARCLACEPERHQALAWSFVRYGKVPLCKQHACAFAGASDAPFVREALERVKAVAFESEMAGGGVPCDVGRAHNPNPNRRPSEARRPHGGDQCPLRRSRRT